MLSLTRLRHIRHSCHHETKHINHHVLARQLSTRTHTRSKQLIHLIMRSCTHVMTQCTPKHTHQPIALNTHKQSKQPTHFKVRPCTHVMTQYALKHTHTPVTLKLTHTHTIKPDDSLDHEVLHPRHDIVRPKTYTHTNPSHSNTHNQTR
jgi:hypothetical protein